jgi:SAM-dependent methyltransferase
MIGKSRTFDPIWEEKYAHGHAQLYPWDAVVSFVFRSAPRGRPRDQVRILEIGCGTASNLWFAAREGFKVAGVDGSESAIEYAKQRFQQEGLTGDLQNADFINLPFEDTSFDLIIDCYALTCCGFLAGRQAVEEIRRVSRPNAKFLFNPYSDRHSSYVRGVKRQDGLVDGISAGTLVGAGQICFYGRSDVERALENGWDVLSIEHVEIAKVTGSEQTVHAEWRVIAEIS